MGLEEASLSEIYKKFKPLIAEECPSDNYVRSRTSRCIKYYNTAFCRRDCPAYRENQALEQKIRDQQQNPQP